jgi:ribosomal protein S14
MKKLVEKDKKTRKIVQKLEKKTFILKVLRNNLNLPVISRFNALNDLNRSEKKASKTLISNRCTATVNKKKFGKWTHYSRIFFLKLARTEKIYGLTKSSW